ncbi:hypothetical protein D7030_02735 [Flavobacteriaceae bacterium AU392]|nr:hypothetical protein D1817_09210 [Flavobacteriaceae bacterium]RKM85606.1 hypothetical protein D7030_02735 [Flavobacteriaceae bacterium AU392]
MKKRFLLTTNLYNNPYRLLCSLMALLILSCSSDDDNNDQQKLIVGEFEILSIVETSSGEITPFPSDCDDVPSIVFNNGSTGILTAFDSFTECVFVEDNITYIINGNTLTLIVDSLAVTAEITTLNETTLIFETRLIEDIEFGDNDIGDETWTLRRL